MIRNTSRPWQWRTAIRPPDWKTFETDLQQRFLRIDAAVERLASVAATLPTAGLVASLPPPQVPHANIHHRLSAKFPPVRHPIDLLCARREREMLARLGAANSDIPLTPCNGILGKIAQHFTGSDKLRTRSIATEPDPAGRHVVFIRPEAIAGQLDQLDFFLQSSKHASPAFRAIVALVMITNCHPFSDGNGRAARIFCNTLLDENTPLGRFYLPIREIAIFSRGGYIIRVRQAEIHGNWLPIADFILAACMLWQHQLEGHSRHVEKIAQQIA
jgi:Fic/DOC family